MATISRGINIVLLLLALFIFVVSILNCVEYTDIINGSQEGPNITKAKVWFGFNVVVTLIAGVYLVYRMYILFNYEAFSHDFIQSLKGSLVEPLKLPETNKRDFSTFFSKPKILNGISFGSKPATATSALSSSLDLKRATD